MKDIFENIVAPLIVGFILLLIQQYLNDQGK